MTPRCTHRLQVDCLLLFKGLHARERLQLGHWPAESPCYCFAFVLASRCIDRVPETDGQLKVEDIQGFPVHTVFLLVLSKLCHVYSTRTRGSEIQYIEFLPK